MRRNLILTLIALFAAVVLATPALGQGGSGQAAPSRQAVQAAAQASQPPAQNQAHAPRYPEDKPDLSCPDAPAAPGIYPFRFGPFFGGKYLVNYAEAISSAGVPYLIYAGAPDDAPQQGLLRVLRDDNDPCAVLAAGDSSFIRDTAAPRGPLTITLIDGDTVVVTTAGGPASHFNYLTGQFSP